MQVFFLTFIIFGLAMFGLAIGWLFNQRALKGSCGGVSAVPGMEDHQCSCSSPCEKRKERMRREANGLESKEEVIEFKV
ncbi:MAG: (Na+)-NQR maturation NqrM [Thiolinea sp.]